MHRTIQEVDLCSGVMTVELDRFVHGVDFLEELFKRGLTVCPYQNNIVSESGIKMPFFDSGEYVFAFEVAHKKIHI